MPRDFKVILHALARMNQRIHRRDKPQRAGVKQPAGASMPATPGQDAAAQEGVTPNKVSEAASNN